jgi:hypothetical protein
MGKIIFAFIILSMSAVLFVSAGIFKEYESMKVSKNVSPSHVAYHWPHTDPEWADAIRTTGKFADEFQLFITILNPTLKYKEKVMKKLEMNNEKCLYYTHVNGGEEILYIFANFNPLPEEKE